MLEINKQEVYINNWHCLCITKGKLKHKHQKEAQATTTFQRRKNEKLKNQS